MDDFKVNAYITPERLQEDVSINDTDLTSAMMTQASMYAHYATLAAKAAHQADRFKVMVEIVEAGVDKRLRDAAAEAGEKITEALVAKQIQRDREYVKALNAYNEAKMIAALAKSALTAFEQRRDMLIQLGASAREEAKGELRLKTVNARHEAAKTAAIAMATRDAVELAG